MLSSSEKATYSWANASVDVQQILWCTTTYAHYQSTALTWAESHGIPAVELYHEDLVADEGREMSMLGNFLGFAYTPEATKNHPNDGIAISGGLTHLENWAELWQALTEARLDHHVWHAI